MGSPAGAAWGRSGSARVTLAARRSTDDRAALATWLGTRLGVALLAFASAWMIADAAAGQVPSWLSGWDRWDSRRIGH